MPDMGSLVGNALFCGNNLEIMRRQALTGGVEFERDCHELLAGPSVKTADVAQPALCTPCSEEG